jgi:hypothetical protein
LASIPEIEEGDIREGSSSEKPKAGRMCDTILEEKESFLDRDEEMSIEEISNSSYSED